MRYVYRHMDGSTSCQRVETETVSTAVTGALTPGRVRSLLFRSFSIPEGYSCHL